MALQLPSELKGRNIAVASISEPPKKKPSLRAPRPRANGRPLLASPMIEPPHWRSLSYSAPASIARAAAVIDSILFDFAERASPRPSVFVPTFGKRSNIRQRASCGVCESLENFSRTNGSFGIPRFLGGGC